MKKLITFVTAASLLAGSMCTTAYAVTFADINTVTWSGFVPFIEEAAELGLMSGYDENGKKYCKPRNNVTYCEAVQLMYSIMKVYTGKDVSDTVVTKWKPVMSGYDVPTWAYKATAYALENEIIYPHEGDTATICFSPSHHLAKVMVGTIFDLLTQPEKQVRWEGFSGKKEQYLAHLRQNQ